MQSSREARATQLTYTVSEPLDSVTQVGFSSFWHRVREMKDVLLISLRDNHFTCRFVDFRYKKYFSKENFWSRNIPLYFKINLLLFSAIFQFHDPRLILFNLISFSLEFYEDNDFNYRFSVVISQLNGGVISKLNLKSLFISVMVFYTFWILR